MKKNIILVLFSMLVSVATCAEPGVVESGKPGYVFSFFRDNGQAGVFLAWSSDALIWKEVNEGKPVLTPQVGGKLTRDPSIVRGPDGMYHMVWTTSWKDDGFGVAHSKDLLNWSEQAYIPVNKDEPGAENTWAPEIFYDDATQMYIVIWATTIEGRFPETRESGDHNHRMYCTTTKDFKQWTPKKLFYDGGFNVIDAFLFKMDGRYGMIVKDETKLPNAEKNLHVVWSEGGVMGPWGKAGAAFTDNTESWAEGPAVIRSGNRWLIYYDKYNKGGYGAVATQDFKTFKPVPVSLPQGIHHGTIVQVDSVISSSLNRKSIDLSAKGTLRPEGSDWPPVIGAWFWKDSALEPDGYKPFLDVAAAESAYTLLSTSLRISKGEIVDPHVREQIGKAVRYADSLGLKIAFDFDVRLARRAFQSRYPAELQEELVLKLVESPASGSVQVTFTGKDLRDHMTGCTIPYNCLTTRLVRAYSFVRGGDGIDPATVRIISQDKLTAVADGPRKLTVTVLVEAGRSVCVMASHTYLTPDVFAPHLLSFQREIIQQYADLPLVGVMKDEWGFPPDHSGNPAHDRYWYSKPMAQVYAECSGGRDLLRDALLMCFGEKGRICEQQAAINRYRRLCRERNVKIEDDFYNAGKEFFGKDAVVVTHSTWTPYPGAQEFRKHGLDWWEATRDIGQCDESTPYSCRTSLAKRWGYPLWYNQYYSPKLEAYAKELWAGALSGGRLNFHPLYPCKTMPINERHCILMRQPFMRGLMRLRMLDFITHAPLNCPVAVVFGHAAAMNWTHSSYNRVGMNAASALSAQGYPVDLFPSSLVNTSSLRIDDEEYVCLGPQRYSAVVLFEPEFGSIKELSFFTRAAAGKSALFIVGEWTRDQNGQSLDAGKQLQSKIKSFKDEESCVQMVQQYLEKTNVSPVTGWTERVKSWGQPGKAWCAAPPMSGHTLLTDGTYIRVAGSTDTSGNPIQETFSSHGHSVTVDAVGIVAIRFAKNGQLMAFAAGGLHSVKTDGLELTLHERVDIAFERGADDRFHGVLQGLAGEVPDALKAITDDWQRLNVKGD